MSNIIAIHQPNFFPWLGFFDKINRCDKFVILDNVQYQKTGGTWTNRVKIIINKEGKWITAPIVRNYHGVKKINEVYLQTDDKWKIKILKTIKNNYSKTLYFNELYDFISELILYDEKNVAKYNLNSILRISKKLGIDINKIVLASDLKENLYELKSNELLIDIVKKVNGDSYLCGSGSQAYQNDDSFNNAGINVINQNFNVIEYTQNGMDEFVNGLSIIDLLMNLGWEKSANFLNIVHD